MHSKTQDTHGSGLVRTAEPASSPHSASASPRNQLSAECVSDIQSQSVLSDLRIPSTVCAWGGPHLADAALNSGQHLHFCWPVSRYPCPTGVNGNQVPSETTLPFSVYLYFLVTGPCNKKFLCIRAWNCSCNFVLWFHTAWRGNYHGNLWASWTPKT